MKLAIPAQGPSLAVPIGEPELLTGQQILEGLHSDRLHVRIGLPNPDQN